MNKYLTGTATGLLLVIFILGIYFFILSGNTWFLKVAIDILVLGTLVVILSRNL